jgi:hypothetical protein
MNCDAINRQSARIRVQPAFRMKRIGCILFLLFAFMATPVHGEWREYTISTGAFAVSMPTAPVIEKHAVDTDFGFIDTQVVLAKTGPSVAYAVVYCEYPQDALFCIAPEKYLNKASDQMVRKMNGDLISESQILLDGFPGREIKMSVPNGILHLKLFAVGKRSYQVYAVGLNDSASHTDARKFLTSFRLLKELSSRATSLPNP